MELWAEAEPTKKADSNYKQGKLIVIKLQIRLFMKELYVIWNCRSVLSRVL